MSLLLKMPFQGNAIVRFDEATGEMSQVDSEDITQGVADIQNGNNVALYALNGDLIFQAGSKKFVLNDTSTQVSYSHNIGSARTFFSSSDDTCHFEIEYKAWWSGIGFPINEPEQDRDEDFFAYVHFIWANADFHSKLIQKWNGPKD